MTNFFRRLLAGLLISFFVLNAGALAYDDVPYTSPYFYSVEYLRRNHVVPEGKTFRPDILISKAEFIKYLVLLNSPDFKGDGQSVDLPFLDTENTAWYASYFQEAITLGILYPEEVNIYPYKKLAVVEALELLFHSKSIPIPRKYVGGIPYKDVEQNEKFQAMVMRAIQLGVAFPERDDYFGIYKRVTRVMAADMIFKMDMVDLRDPNNSAISDPYLERVVDSWRVIQSDFFDRDRADSQKLSDSAIQAMVESLEDPYSVFLPHDLSQALADDNSGQFEGIGIFLEVTEQKEFLVSAPIKGSPAEKAGLKPGDIITKVDDFDTAGSTLYEVASKIKGPKGTTVTLTINRSGQTLMFDVVRDAVTVNSLDYETVDNGKIMRVNILNFNRNLGSDFRKVAEVIAGNSAIKGLVIDLRDNPGGLVDSAIEVLGVLLPKGSEALHFKYNYLTFTEWTTGDGLLKDYPMAVLVNKNSASASEMVAGALQDYGFPVIGETSFGKGTAQEIYTFNDNSSLKLTIARWLTPKKRSIQDVGLTPDITVAEAASGSNDPQLQRAIQEVKAKIR